MVAASESASGPAAGQTGTLAVHHGNSSEKHASLAVGKLGTHASQVTDDTVDKCVQQLSGSSLSFASEQQDHHTEDEAVTQQHGLCDKAQQQQQQQLPGIPIKGLLPMNRKPQSVRLLKESRIVLSLRLQLAQQMFPHCWLFLRIAQLKGQPQTSLVAHLATAMRVRLLQFQLASRDRQITQLSNSFSASVIDNIMAEAAATKVAQQQEATIKEIQTQLVSHTSRIATLTSAFSDSILDGILKECHGDQQAMAVTKVQAQLVQQRATSGRQQVQLINSHTRISEQHSALLHRDAVLDEALDRMAKQHSALLHKDAQLGVAHDRMAEQDSALLHKDAQLADVRDRSAEQDSALQHKDAQLADAHDRMAQMEQELDNVREYREMARLHHPLHQANVSFLALKKLL